MCRKSLCPRRLLGAHTTGSSIRPKLRIIESGIFAIVLTLCLLVLRVEGQVVQEAQPAAFLRSNDHFALNLLSAAHQVSLDRNIVLAPLPVSLAFAALLEGTADTASEQELISAFHWRQSFAPSLAGRMLLARFEKPKPYPIPRSSSQTRRDDPILKLLQSGKPEQLWLTMAFLYRGQNSLSQDFIDRVSHDFGFPFRSVGENTSQSEILAKNWDSSLPMPKITGPNDFWITSFTHLRTSWAGNTFADTKGAKRDFHLRSGETIQAEFLPSEAASYLYARADEFEAIQLNCWQATILFVLPPPGSDIAELEAALAKNPDMVEPFLLWHQGDVQMPTFHFTYETDMRDSLQKLGVHLIFFNANTLLSMAPSVSGGMLRGVAQKTEITVDGNGIRSDSGTIFHGVYGGILQVQSPFHMVLDRPFLFLIRDPVTRALLFVGAVMNPTLP